MDAGERDALAAAVVEGLLDSPRFAALLDLAALHAVVKYREAALLELPRLLTATCAAEGVALRVDAQGKLYGRGKGAVREEVRSMIALYRDDLIGFLRTVHPENIDPPVKP